MGAGGHGSPGFKPWSGHTTLFKKDSNRFLSLVLRIVGLSFRLTDWCKHKRTSSIGSLPKKCRDVTEKQVESGAKHHISNLLIGV